MFLAIPDSRGNTMDLSSHYVVLSAECLLRDVSSALRYGIHVNLTQRNVYAMMMLP